MFFVYLLQSEKDGSFYIGRTQNLDKRLNEHNAGKVYYTSRKLPWQRIYQEGYLHEELSKEREKQLKKFGSAYVGLMKRLKLKF